MDRVDEYKEEMTLASQDTSIPRVSCLLVFLLYNTTGSDSIESNILSLVFVWNQTLWSDERGVREALYIENETKPLKYFSCYEKIAKENAYGLCPRGI
jgi:hypothetical protein